MFAGQPGVSTSSHVVVRIFSLRRMFRLIWFIKSTCQARLTRICRGAPLPVVYCICKLPHTPPLLTAQPLISSTSGSEAIWSRCESVFQNKYCANTRARWGARVSLSLPVHKVSGGPNQCSPTYWTWLSVSAKLPGSCPSCQFHCPLSAP